MKHTSNTVYTVLASILLAFIIMFTFTAASDAILFGGSLLSANEFYTAKSADDLLKEEGEREKFKLRCRAVTAEDYASLEGHNAISVELSVVSSYLDFVSDYSSYRTEYYELIGLDNTDALWLVSISRGHMDDPVPTDAYPAGTDIIVYGYLRGDEYIAAYETRAPEIRGEYIDVVG